LLAAARKAGLRRTDVAAIVDEIRRIDDDRVNIRGWTPDIASLTDAMASWLRDIGIERPHVVGNSLGGGIAPRQIPTFGDDTSRLAGVCNGRDWAHGCVRCDAPTHLSTRRRKSRSSHKQSSALAYHERRRRAVSCARWPSCITTHISVCIPYTSGSTGTRFGSLPRDEIRISTDAKAGAGHRDLRHGAIGPQRIVFARVWARSIA
jgi:hypothetical protein